MGSEQIETWRDKCVMYLNGIEAAHPKKWDGFRTLLIGGPPIYIAFCTIRQKLPFQDAAQEFATAHPYSVLVALISPLVFTFIFRCLDNAFARLRQKDVVPKLFIASILSAFRNVTKERLISSERVAKSVGANTTKAEVFDGLALAKTHAEIMFNLYGIIREITRDNTLQLILVKMRQNLPYDWLFSMPRDITLPQSLLTEYPDKTLFSHAAKEKEPIIIKDIAKHISTHRRKRQYHPLGNPNYDKGSIVCYPIEHQLTNDIVYTLSVKSDVPGVIAPNLVDSIKDVVRVFKMQLMIEYNFDYIRERAI